MRFALKLLIFLTFPLISQLLAGEKNTGKIIVITAQKPIKSPLLTPSFERITADKIATFQLHWVKEILQQQPGINVVQSGGIGQQSSVFIRGTNSNHVAVRIDGMKANHPDAPSGGFDFADLTTDNLSVEIIRGAAGSLYGDGAVGGVINIKSAKGNGSLKKVLAIEGNSIPSESLKSGINGEYGKLNFSLNASVFHTQGLPVTPEYLRLPAGKYPDLPYNSRSFNLRGGGQMNETTEITLFSRIQDAFLSYQDGLNPIPQQQRQSLNRLQLDYIPSTNWAHQLGFGILSTARESAKGQSTFSRSHGQRISGDWQQKIKINSVYQIQTTVEVEQESFQANDAAVQSEAKQQQLGMVVLQQWKPVESLLFEFALRKDWSNRFRTPPSYNLGLRQTFPQTELFINHGTAFKAPSLFQLYGKTAYFKGSKDLQTERIDSYELGLKQQLTSKIKATVICFHNNLHQLIDYDLILKKNNNNIAKAQTKGIETSLNILPNVDTKLEFNHTLTITRNQLTNQSLLRRPQHKVVILGSYTYESMQFITEWLFVGSRLDLKPQYPYQEVKNKPYNTLSIKVNYELRSNWIIYSRVENILNKKIEEPLGYSQAKVTGYVGIKATF